MKIIKKVQGHDIELDLIKVKDYPRYTLFNVYKEDVLLYKTCFTSLQIQELVLKGYILDDEEIPVKNIIEEDIICL